MQHGWPVPPHADTHRVSTEHARPLGHDPLQHVWPICPHGSQLPLLVLQLIDVPVHAGVAAQHGCPFAPHAATQRPANEHTMPPVHWPVVPGQQISPGAPQCSQCDDCGLHAAPLSHSAPYRPQHDSPIAPHDG